jgi:hypothetical protein
VKAVIVVSFCVELAEARRDPEGVLDALQNGQVIDTWARRSLRRLRQKSDLVLSGDLLGFHLEPIVGMYEDWETQRFMECRHSRLSEQEVRSDRFRRSYTQDSRPENAVTSSPKEKQTNVE